MNSPVTSLNANFGKLALLVGTFIVLVLLVVFGTSYYGAAVDGVNFEEGIIAQVQQNKNKYSTFTQTAVEKMMVADKYKDALKEVMTAAIEGRYGKDGSKAAVQAMQERYPGQLDPSLYMQISAGIEAGRRDFSYDQTMLISKVQQYRSALKYPWSGMWLKKAGYPTIDLSKPEFNPIVSEQTDNNFKTGTDTGIKFN
jgi:hypothetical protein